MLIPDGVVTPGFSGPTRVAAWLPGEWAFTHALTYTALDGSTYTIPAGFIMDFASLPRPAKAIYPVDDETRSPAALHDWLYCSQVVTREEADALFLEALDRAGIRWSKRQVYYRAVRAGGWMYWNKHGEQLRQDDFLSGAQLEWLRA